MTASSILCGSCIALPLPLFVCIYAGYDQIVCVCSGQLSCNYSTSQWRLREHFLSLKAEDSVCGVCGLPGAVSSVIHTGCVCCLCILYQQSICTLSPTAHRDLCMDSNSRAVFLLVMSLRRD